ncbi:hypothetical protein CPLU01_15419 [Colletotrichum plurivorum]|uniref:Ankyrin repeat protein n=1 Tax=Colletotrichum plurivorum TaxID=2175906 RepID=A0A8H6MVQ9_9PEZI|nr:hypothetical protein CPLU01_15419 [Colletotrichum plurivorum]
MQLFKFPPELRDEILFRACLARGLTRALRLKLVCKTFRHAVDLTLFRTRFLDEPVYLDGWCFRENFGFAELFQAYISFRIRSPPLPDDGRIADLRSVCRWLAAETQTDVSLVIDALSKAAIGPIGMASMSDNERRKGTNHVLPSPMFLAAWAGRADMLTLLQEHLPEFEEVKRYLSHGGRFLDFRAKTGPGSIEGAAASGSLDMVRLAMFPPSRADPNDFHFDPYQHGRLDTQPRLRACLSRALDTGSSEIYKYISSFYDRDARMRHDLGRWTIGKHSRFGHVDVVRYLLDQGAAEKSTGPCSLVYAAKASQVEVVDLLLKGGVHPNVVDPFQGPAVLGAANVGSLTIVRMLLDRGATVDEERGRELLRSAVRREHVAMVRLLLDRGVCDAKFHAGIVDMALEEGLESMADLLRRERVTG